MNHMFDILRFLSCRNRRIFVDSHDGSGHDVQRLGNSANHLQAVKWSLGRHGHLVFITVFEGQRPIGVCRFHLLQVGIKIFDLLRA